MADRLGATFTLHELAKKPDRTGWLAEHGERIDYVLTDGHLGIDSQTLAALPNLRAVSSYGVGYDAVDIEAALARDVPVSHTPGVLDEEVATTALLLLLACFRNFEAQTNHARSGAWARDGSLPLARSADGRTIGILGLGRIGKAIARKLTPFSSRILYTGRSKQDVAFSYYDSLTEMAGDADALISIVPGGVATHHLINAEVLDALGPEGILINVGRGSTVDEAALIDALSSGTLGAAGLDVFEDEPNIPDALRGLPNVTLTPHIGSATVETRAAMGNLAIDNLLRHFESGKLLSPVPECAHLA
jgi:lactate dehydrogenase-like 2-hydroxyacid dehydrogenase